MERPPDIDVRRNTGIFRSSLDEIKAIQTLLADIYKDAGDGRTLLRELVQNADDARAQQLKLIVLECGWPDARNSLLRGPALLVSNDGAFTDKDREALHKAIGGSKEDEVGKIGTFGIGLKSVFHICEAFLYIGAEKSEWRAGVLNPWAGTGENGDADPLHPDWDEIDAERLQRVATYLLGNGSNGFLLWIPLRRPEHLDRSAGERPYGLGERCPHPNDLCAWFKRSAPAALLLAQCGHLRTIDTARAAGPENLRDRKTLAHVGRRAAGWVGRYREDDGRYPDQPFEGEIFANDRNWSVAGIEVRGSETLRQLQSRPDWPQSPKWENGRHSSVRRKALAHAAVTVLQPSDPEADLSGARLRWAVFLPLDDDPEPNSSAIVESIESKSRSPAWEIILHGYFWPSQDRRSIPGVTDHAASDGEMRIRWNQALCNELLLPLLPSALAKAVAGVGERAARPLLEAVVRSAIVKDHLDVIRRRHWLLPAITADGVRWKALDAGSRLVLSIPKWRQAPEVVRRKFAASSGECTDDVVFIDEAVPRIVDALGNWTEDHLERLLICIPGDAFKSPQSLQWIERYVRHVIGPDACGENIRAAAVARWLARQISDGALAHTTQRSAPRESRDELRSAWRNLCGTLPDAWLVDAPVESQQAVAEIAARSAIGKGLFPVPFGRPRDEPPAVPHIDQERLDNALKILGRRLKSGSGTEGLRHSCLLLAETLLSKRPKRPLSEHLDELPLLRATRFPEDREEAWSIAELRRRIENRRVFTSPDFGASDSEDTGGIQPERPSDPKRAVMELAKALGEAVWMVNRTAVAPVVDDVPSPVPEALASAVLRSETFAADPARRKPLLERLAPAASKHANACRAARSLLAGRTAGVVGENAKLFNGRGGNGGALRILLRLLGRPWCEVQRMLVQPLSQDVLDTLSVGRADRLALHRLLGECLDKLVAWSDLSDEEALQLLRDLHGTTPEELKRWSMMPLHRGIDGRRAAFNDQARRSTGKADELSLPSELEAEVRLLDPECEIAHLYASVPEMDRDGLLRLMLEDSCPWRFADEIMCCVHASEGSVSLPQDRELRDLLRRKRWLPKCDGGALAPDAVLIAPPQLLDAVSDLAEADAFGDKRLPEAVDPRVWRTAKPIIQAILGSPGPKRQVQRIGDALDSDQAGQANGGAWLVMQKRDLVDASLVEDALQTTLAGSHPGWKLVHAADGVVKHGDDGGQDSPEPLVKLAKALCSPIPPDRQIEMLRSLGESRPAKDSHAGRLFRAYLKCFAEADCFFEHVLPKIDLPTQDGNWHASRYVARTETGVARRHRLPTELRPVLRLSGDDLANHASSAGSNSDGTELDVLEKYFEPWRGRVQHGAIGAFLSLFGKGLNNRIGNLAQQWIGEDVAIEPIEGLDRDAVSVWISPRVSRGDRVSAVNILGSRVEMEAEAGGDTLFAVDPIRYPSSRNSALAPLGDFWEIALRDVEPLNCSRSDLMALLLGSVERWAIRYLKLDREQVYAWWSDWGEGSQADFGPVLASIKAHLPLTLQQLDVKESEQIRDALRKAEQAQRKREQAPSEEALKSERKALDHLAGLIDEPRHQELLWKRVNELMRRYGYGDDSVLLELAQNADDALAEAGEIKGEPLSPKACRLLIRVHEHDGTPTVDVTHWGRPINDTGGAAFPAGRERQWDQDLYFMMLMNLSGKPGETPGESSSSSTTGRFGLGFKSVHLVSQSPSVVSGFIAFTIAGGLLPQEQAVPDETDSRMLEGHRPTRVRLPLRSDVEAQPLIERLFRRFAYARALLPALARQVREVVVEGGPFPGIHRFDEKSINGAPGWSVGSEIDLPNHPGRWQILRFRPNDTGTAALAIGLRDGLPSPFNPDVPFLWNVAPTSESWGCGYIVNGPFKLDPGRTHVSLDNDTTLRAVRSLGEALGQGLIALHKVLSNPADALRGPLTVRDGRSFVAALWRVLACGMNNSDAMRQSFLRKLHGNGSGLSAWIGACTVVPSGLPAPFQTMLPPLISDVRIEVASGDFDNDACTTLSEIEDEDLKALVGDRCIVSLEVEQLLRPLCNPEDTTVVRITPTPLRLFELFTELAERWSHCLTPERLHALRPIDGGGDRNFDAYDPQGVTWRSELKARAADGSIQSLRNLLLRKAPDWLDHTDPDAKDELLRAAFAPDNQVLDPAYIDHREDWRVFRWLRDRHRVDAAMMAKWCANLPEGLHAAAIHYLLYGELGSNVLQHLVPVDGRPSWLREYDDVRRLVENQCEEPWRRQSLLGALFPDKFHLPEPPPVPIPPDSDTFFKQFLEWWDDDAERSAVISDYEKDAWPNWLRRDGIATSLRSDSEDHWLALLVLGACRSLGRTQDRQHRSFLELVHGKGWWEVFKTPDDDDAWMGVLRDWQDDALAKLTYPRWMSLFPAIYQFSRFRAVYVRLLKSAGLRSESMYQINRLLAPRVDEALTGAGTRFNAPPAPLNMGLHWVLRELVRLKVIKGEHLFLDCWVPSGQVLHLLETLGLHRSNDSMSNSDKAHAIFNFLVNKLGTETPNLHLAFDIPLRRVDSDANLRHRFGLEQ